MMTFLARAAGKIREAPASANCWLGNVTGITYTHASPDDDTNYYWITACNSGGCSDIDSGNPAQFIATQSASTAPGSPHGLDRYGERPDTDRPVVDCAIG